MTTPTITIEERNQIASEHDLAEFHTLNDYHKQPQNFVVDWVADRDVPMLLDAPCGSGFLSQRVPSTYTGLDRNPDAVAVTREVSGQNAVVGDLHHLPFAAGMFDAVATLDVSYFDTFEMEAFLEQTQRILRPGGSLVMDVARHEHEFYHDGNVLLEGEFQAIAGEYFDTINCHDLPMDRKYMAVCEVEL